MDTLQTTFDGYMTRKISELYYLYDTKNMKEMQTELQDLKAKINKITESLNTEIDRIDAHDSRLDDNETNIDDVFDDFDVTDHCNLSELISGYIDEDKIARNVANELKIVTR